MKTYFGTDGIRGRANGDGLTPEMALRLGRAAGAYFRRGDHRHSVVMGKDTRLSGYMIESALAAGFTSAGMDVRMIGPVPTPAVGQLTRSMRADLGVMITASHNPFCDNGIKLFGPDGFKLADEAELEIEALMDDPARYLAADPAEIGQLRRYDDAKGRYVEAVKASIPAEIDLDGVRVVLDCANGAAYKVAPLALTELGADVDAIGVSPNGVNINAECGSTHTGRLVARVRETGADIGIALDGDGDRAILCDETGRIIDGDQIIARIALDRRAAGTLRGGGAVTTVMSNFAMERFLNEQDLKLVRTQVGDRYVVEAMRRGGYNVGGEQSGHVVLTDHATTGDGTVAALQILAACVRAQKPASEVCDLFEPAPQTLVNVRYEGEPPLSQPGVRAAIAEAERRLGASGRILVRASGTEPVIRILAEGEDAELIKRLAADIAGAMETVQAA
jgi:phosphoglucosamine mutase